MTYVGKVTVTANGKFSVPSKILDKLGVRTGDTLRFWMTGAGELTMKVSRRRRIFIDRLGPFELPSIAPPDATADIDAAIAEGVNARHGRVPRRKKRDPANPLHLR